MREHDFITCTERLALQCQGRDTLSQIGIFRLLNMRALHSVWDTTRAIAFGSIIFPMNSSLVDAAKEIPLCDVLTMEGVCNPTRLP